MGQSGDAEVATDGGQDAAKTPPSGAQEPRRRRHTGGKKGAKKPSNLLKAMRWVSENAVKEGETLTPLRANCRKLQVEDLTEFMRQLAGLEKAQAARKAPAPTSGLSGTGVPENGSSGPTRGDKGEETIFELIDKLLADFSVSSRRENAHP
jgi:hypothetical protein